MSEIVWSWDGSAIARPSSLGAVWTVLGWRLSPAMALYEDKRIDLLEADIDTTETLLHPQRDLEIAVRADCTGITGANIERKIKSGWGELTAAFNPLDGVVKAQVASPNSAGATITRYLLARCQETPSYTARTGDPGGIWDSGAYESGHVVYVIRARTVFPYWIGSALLNQDTAPADAELAIGAAPDTVTISNASPRWVGVRVDVKNGSVSGSVTGIQIDNAANDDQLIITNSGSFDEDDYVDFLATDPRKIDRADTNNKFTGAGHNRLRLAPGSNVLTGTRLTGAGTLTLSLSWTYLDLTI